MIPQYAFRKKLKYALCTCLAVGAAAIGATPLAGCGGGNNDQKTGTAASAGNPSESSSPYVAALREFRQAVAAETTYDAYGYAEYFPATQKAAIDALCFIADQMPKNPAAESLEDPANLTRSIVSKAEADLKSEQGIVAPRPAHRAIEKLRTVLGLQSLDPDLAKSYARACYH